MEDHVWTMEEDHPDIVDCPYCGSSAPRIYRVQIRKEFWPYVTPHLTGDPVEIQSRQHRDRLFKENSVTQIEPGIKASAKTTKMRPLREDLIKTAEDLKNNNFDLEAMRQDQSETTAFAASMESA
jgi:hypothetical protein